MGKLKVTLVKSKSGATDRQIRTIEAIGLGRRTSFVEVDDNPVFQGMISKIQHLITVEKL